MDSESTREPRRGLTRAELVKGLGKFAGGVALFFATVESVTVTVAWSRGELTPLEAADGLWIVLLPLWIGLFLRYYSILRPDCGTCQLPHDAASKKPAQ
jgi:hypothetical protein